MGLGDWWFANTKELDSQGGKEQPVTRSSIQTAESLDQFKEVHTSRQKFVLYLFLTWEAVIWHDILSALFGLPGKLFSIAFFAYVLVLCWPSSFGKWEMKDRMQIRSILIIKLTMLTICFPASCLWFFSIADAKWLSFMPFPILRTLFLLYVGWFLTWDRMAPKRGVRYLPQMRRRAFWRHLASYFPIKLTRTKRLDPEKNYLFGYHPHGIISFGAIANFGTFATGSDVLFEGLDIRVLTLELNFKFPIWREYLLSMGVSDCSKDSILYNLSQKGRSVVLVVGGAAEALETSIGSNTLVLENRKGFVKMALLSGAHLVPVFSFGENDLYDVLECAGWRKRWQLWFMKKLGFSTPVFFGRALTGGILHRLFGVKRGIFPFRTPIHSVVGKPIEVPKMKDADITKEILDKYHALYTKELNRIHDEWKVVFDKEKKERFEALQTDEDRAVILSDFEKLKGESENMKTK
jgi:hypothetical protein